MATTTTVPSSGTTAGKNKNKVKVEVEVEGPGFVGPLWHNTTTTTTEGTEGSEDVVSDLDEFAPPYLTTSDQVLRDTNHHHLRTTSSQDKQKQQQQQHLVVAPQESEEAVCFSNTHMKERRRSSTTTTTTTTTTTRRRDLPTTTAANAMDSSGAGSEGSEGSEGSTKGKKAEGDFLGRKSSRGPPPSAVFSSLRSQEAETTVVEVPYITSLGCRHPYPGDRSNQNENDPISSQGSDQRTTTGPHAFSRITLNSSDKSESETMVVVRGVGAIASAIGAPPPAARKYTEGGRRDSETSMSLDDGSLTSSAYVNTDASAARKRDLSQCQPAKEHCSFTSGCACDSNKNKKMRVKAKTPRPVSIECLSDELLHKIVCHLDPKSALNVKCTSKHFKEIIEDTRVWRSSMENYVGEACTQHLSRSYPDIPMEELARQVVTLEGMKWTSRKVGGKVSPSRCNFSSCAAGSKIVIFGGDHYQQALNDTFVLDLRASNPEWKKLHMRECLPPPGRFGHTLRAVDENTVALFGGCGNSRLHNDTYLLDVSSPSPQWRQVKAANPPVERVWHSSCVVSKRKLVVYGGCDNVGELLDDLHVLDLKDLKDSHGNESNVSWKKVDVGEGWKPAARIGHSMTTTSDNEEEQVVVFGGMTYIKKGSAIRARDNSSFVIDLGKREPKWRMLKSHPHPAAGRGGGVHNLPSPRLDHVCWRLPGNRQIVFGGSPSVFGPQADVSFSSRDKDKTKSSDDMYLLDMAAGSRSGVGFSGLASTTTTKSSPSAVWKKIKFEGEGPQSAWTHCACVVEHGTKCIVLGGMKGQDWMLNELQELSIIKNTTAGRNTTAVASAANAAAAVKDASSNRIKQQQQKQKQKQKQEEQEQKQRSKKPAKHHNHA